MRRFLPIALISVACCLTACVSHLPDNTTKNGQYKLVVGPLGSVESSWDSSSKVKNPDGVTSTVTVTNYKGSVSILGVYTLNNQQDSLSYQSK